jgi:hypothetical protein
MISIVIFIAINFTHDCRAGKVEFVAAEANAGDDIGGTEGSLLDLRKVVGEGAVQLHSNLDEKVRPGVVVMTRVEIGVVALDKPDF